MASRTPSVITVHTLLMLVDCEHITREVVEAWTRRQKIEAEKWAIASYYKASDNLGVRVPRRPIHVTKEGSHADITATTAGKHTMVGPHSRL